MNPPAFRDSVATLPDQNGYAYGSSVTYTCSDGLYVTGDVTQNSYTSICGETGAWSVTAGQCQGNEVMHFFLIQKFSILVITTYSHF